MHSVLSADSPGLAYHYDDLVVADVLRDLWTEPAPDSSSRSRLDSVVILALVALGLVDGLLSEDVGWPGLTIPLMMALPFALYWRRTHILTVTMVVFGTYAVLHGAMLIAGVTSTMLNVGIVVITVYTLARWASGREATIGLGIAAAGTAIGGSTGVLRDFSGAIGLPIFVSLFVLAGLAVRFWSSRGTARLGEAKMAERNRIARELHDTVAHHVSAIAIQAQGGQAILATNPEAAGQALAVIEEQASLTLTEMRLILGVLRDQDPADRSPASGLKDLARLADTTESGPKIGVTMSGDLANISKSVESALFRIAQEAITNARRHASEATCVAVEVVGSDSHVHLIVNDDGKSSSHGGPGFGLLGMNERATLLGGECQAGPSPAGGWAVKASFPRSGRAA